MRILKLKQYISQISSFHFLLFVFICFVNVQGVTQIPTPSDSFFIIQVKTDNTGVTANNQYQFVAGSSGYTVYWEEEGNAANSGTFIATNATEVITFPSVGIYNIAIDTPNFSQVNLGGVSSSTDSNKLIEIKQWGDILWTSFDNAFFRCSEMDVTATDTPDLTNVTTLNRMFSACSSLVNANNSIGNWNTENITNMARVFHRAANFNINLGLWDVGNVTNFSEMFELASSFNNGGSPDIQTWNIGENTGTTLINCIEVFNSSAFNQPLAAWEGDQSATIPSDRPSTMAYVNFASFMFRSTPFNQNIGSWDVGRVSRFFGMFQAASNFNNGGSPDIQTWNIGENTGTTTITLGRMFRLANSFNQPLSAWEGDNSGLIPGDRPSTLAYVNNTSEMFESTPFNQDIGSWDLGRNVNFSDMFFNATNFNNGGNPSIQAWNIGENTSSMINMSSILNNAQSFNINIGTWDMSQVNNLSNAFDNSGFSVNNYDNMLIAWSTQSLISNLTVGVLNLNYCNAVAERQSIITNFTWNFVTDNLDCTLLPVEFLDVDISSSNCTNNLIWRTATETNNSHFNIQRSSDGIHFTTVGYQLGAGTSLNINRYEFIDEVSSSLYFYRVEQVDFDGTSSFSDIVSIESNCNSMILYPNPVLQGAEATIRGENIHSIKVYDYTGRLLENLEFENLSIVHLPANRFDRGMYIIIVNNTVHLKLMIQ